MGFFDRFKKKNITGQHPFAATLGKERLIPVPANWVEQLMTELERLDYFNYADPVHLPILRAELEEGLIRNQYFPFVTAESHHYDGLDPRHYLLDNETLFEEDGILNALKEMAPVFSKMNIKMEVADHVEEYDMQTGLDHRITLNDKPYVIFHQWNEYGWGEAAQRFADIVNDQLMLQHSDERLYLINGGNDGRAVFLTPGQYEFIRQLIKERRECPLPTQEWSQLMGVEWVNVVSPSR